MSKGSKRRPGKGYEDNWDKIFGGEESDRARSIVQTLDGGYAIAGSTCNYGNGNKLNPDLWLIKTDSEGYSKNFDD